MYSTIADLGKWAGSGLGSTLLPPDLVAKRVATQTNPDGDYSLGIDDWGQGWIGHTGQILGWESMVAYNTKTGAAFVTIVNETSSFVSALSVGLAVFPDLKGIMGH
jgi:D-alanyl-D-alanine carboxypeptidase